MPDKNNFIDAMLFDCTLRSAILGSDGMVLTILAPTSKQNTAEMDLISKALDGALLSVQIGGIPND